MICFNNFTLYIITSLLVIIISLIVMLYNREIYTCKQELIKKQSRNEIPIEIKPQEIYPERKYTGPMQMSSSASNIGYVYNSSHVFPLYMYKIGRNYYYYVIDSSRNNVKIPIENSKNIELYDEDSIIIPELGGTFTIKMYEYSGNIYNP